eukprot:Tamp_05232.p1 GENE.Tamp_05232~~Tamp_05232.p1  ORF type:complete len:422 (+),score=124.54 Tamp_05232:2-1267(+)
MAAAARAETPAAARRAAVFGARPAFPGTAGGGARRLSGAAFQLEPPEETVWPNEKPADGVSYELNWSICGSGVVPLGKAFRNMRLPELAAAGGSGDTTAPAEVAFASVEKEVKGALGDSSTTLYVQDCALGTVLGNEVPVRIVTDNAAAAAMFKTLCAAARTVPLPEYEEDVTVLHTSGASSPYIASSKAKKTVLMGGSFNAGALVQHIAAISGDAFMARGVLPMFGAGADNVVYLSAGFESGAVVPNGFSYSSAGFCRLYGGSAAADGSVAAAGSLPNSLPLPKAVVMFANDATGAIPAASVLDAAQAAFYYVGACAPAGVTNMQAAASLMLELGGKTKVYMINKAAYGSEAEMRDAAKAAVGQSGSAGALGLKVITAGSADQATIDKMAQSLTSAVTGKVKGNEAVIKAGPPVPPPPAK